MYHEKLKQFCGEWYVNREDVFQTLRCTQMLENKNDIGLENPQNNEESIVLKCWYKL